MASLGSIALAVASMAVLVYGCKLVPESEISPELVPAIAQRTLVQASGEYLVDGLPVLGDKRVVQLPVGLQVMKRQLSQAEYHRCVQAGACKPVGNTPLLADDVPMVGLSWLDAQNYAQWLSKRLGRTFRLPSYEEWVAITDYEDESALLALKAAQGQDLAQQWLRQYQENYQRQQALSAVVQKMGSFGQTPQGLLDVAGNVWEWTSTCHQRVHRKSSDTSEVRLENCTIRVLAGKHTAYMADFIRDPKSGACSVGVPPSNLGLRLVAEAPT